MCNIPWLHNYFASLTHTHTDRHHSSVCFLQALLCMTAFFPLLSSFFFFWYATSSENIFFLLQYFVTAFLKSITSYAKFHINHCNVRLIATYTFTPLQNHLVHIRNERKPSKKNSVPSSLHCPSAPTCGLCSLHFPATAS